MDFWKYLFPVKVWMIVIAILLLVSFPSTEVSHVSIPHADKIVHFFLFTTLTLLFCWGLKNKLNTHT